MAYKKSEREQKAAMIVELETFGHGVHLRSYENGAHDRWLELETPGFLSVFPGMEARPQAVALAQQIAWALEG